VSNEGSDGNSRGSRGVEIALRILDLLAGWTGPGAIPRPGPMSLHAIASALAIPEPTAFRIVGALVRSGWIEKVGNEFRLAFKVGLIGVGIHEALRRQAERCQGMIESLDQVRAATTEVGSSAPSGVQA